MKSLLVHLDASPRAAVRLAIAQQLARLHDAELTALYAVLPSMLATPWIAGDALSAAPPLLSEVDRDQRARARALYDAAARVSPLRWDETADEVVVPAIVRRAFAADLVVLGQRDPDDALAGALPADLVPAVITDSGRPTLVIPYAGDFGAGAEHVLVAWKPTREAVRALYAALPWLRRASRVHLALPVEDDTPETPATLRRWLEVHDVGAAVETHPVGPEDVGEMLLSLAADTDAQLLVMGCYGHSRTREWVLGGATRSVLQSMTVPVLMAH
jgi:nucleotide-binding universal stress UspA family protein